MVGRCLQMLRYRFNILHTRCTRHPLTIFAVDSRLRASLNFPFGPAGTILSFRQDRALAAALSNLSVGAGAWFLDPSGFCEMNIAEVRRTTGDGHSFRARRPSCCRGRTDFRSVCLLSLPLQLAGWSGSLLRRTRSLRCATRQRNEENRKEEGGADNRQHVDLHIEPKCDACRKPLQ